MNTKMVVDKIYQFYPKSISSFDSKYYDTNEFKTLSSLVKNRGEQWRPLIEALGERFGREYVRDRSDNEPSNRCAIFFYKGDLLFELVIHISLLVKAFTYYVKKYSVNKEALATSEIDAITNDLLPEVNEDGIWILTIVKKYYKDYYLMSEEIYTTVLPDLSTKNKDLGQATIFNALFADTEL